jgi:hypothetical protein
VDATGRNLTNIGEVREVSSYKDANALLKQGWVLISVIQDARFYHEGSDYSRPLYVLGLSRFSGLKSEE